MKKNNDKELRELDAEMHTLLGWCYDSSRKCWQRKGFWTAEPDKYTTTGAAMEVLEKCNKDSFNIISILPTEKGWKLDNLRFAELKEAEGEEAETLPLAICLFAKNLFTK